MRGDKVKCFLLTATGRYRRYLRRYTTTAKTQPGTPCPHGYHDAAAYIETIDGGGEDGPVSGDLHPHDDPRWPTRCASCGYEFQPGDEYQQSHEREFRRGDTGEMTTLREAPAGAMWLAEWYATYEGLGSPIHQRERAGQPHLVVKTPAGDWNVDQKSRNGDGWSWTGEPPNVTARPSIAIGEAGQPGYYHAWLTDGVLNEI